MSISLERPQVVLVSRCAIQDEDNNLLLLRRTESANHNANLWEFPGGKVDIGQSIEEAQAREVLEETELTIEPTSTSVFIDNRVINDGPYAGMLYAILCGAGKVTGGELKLSSEHTASRWMPPRNALASEITLETREAIRLLGLLAFLRT